MAYPQQLLSAKIDRKSAVQRIDAARPIEAMVVQPSLKGLLQVRLVA